jgi:hypothetical protein
MQPGADDRERFFGMRRDHFTDFLDRGFSHLAVDAADAVRIMKRRAGASLSASPGIAKRPLSSLSKLSWISRPVLEVISRAWLRKW